jgi:SAM-dependent methyltransferase
VIAAPARAVVWHDLECGAYAADLAPWSHLARESAGAVLELGCGTGRVALHLAAEGVEVTGLDGEQVLLDALAQRARERQLQVTCVRADVRDFSIDARFSLICAPMQLAHLLGAGERTAMLERVAAHLTPGGRAAFALLANVEPSEPDASPPLPDVVERDGWVYSSQPLEVTAGTGGYEVRRLRQIVSPAGELDTELDAIRLEDLAPERLVAEAAGAGLVEAERIDVPPTPDHVGSVIVVLQASS